MARERNRGNIITVGDQDNYLGPLFSPPDTKPEKPKPSPKPQVEEEPVVKTKPRRGGERGLPNGDL